MRGAGFGFSTTAASVDSTTAVFFVPDFFVPDADFFAAGFFAAGFLAIGGVAAVFADLLVDFRVDFFVDALTRFGDSTAESTVAVADAFVVIGPLLDLR
ncbi:MAG: hypothetical protein CMJ52_02525 [Planctomycetaceae bacterium]|nr:hypothetical protein [Planctomycetaceae bacterium]